MAILGCQLDYIVEYYVKVNWKVSPTYLGNDEQLQMTALVAPLHIILTEQHPNKTAGNSEVHLQLAFTQLWDSLQTARHHMSQVQVNWDICQQLSGIHVLFFAEIVPEIYKQKLSFALVSPDKSAQSLKGLREFGEESERMNQLEN
ncbi:hypothetical protein STEG23_018532 [Scotinomys teguina]